MHTKAIISVTVRSATPGSLWRESVEIIAARKGATNHSKSEQGIKLYETMEIAEQDGDRQEDQIRRVSCKETNQLDNFGNAHEDNEGDECILLFCR